MNKFFKNKSTSKAIIWLEDRPRTNVDIFRDNLNDQYSKFWNEFYEPVSNFREVRHVIDDLLSKNSEESGGQILGFVIDLLLEEDKDLSAFDIPGIATSNGADAGFMFLVHCVRNFTSKSPWGDTFKKHPVLILTAYEERNFSSRYRDFIMYEEQQKSEGKIGKTTWVTKPHYEKIKYASSKINEWINEIMNSRQG